MVSKYTLGHSLAVNEYLLVIQPDNNVTDKINKIKQDFATKYECSQAVCSKPHITMINFLQFQMNEKRIIGFMDKIIARYNAIHIKVNGFGCFPTHTIYANIETKIDIVELVKKLRPIQSFLKIDKEHRPHYITEPHLTIARKLLPWQYEKGWLEYSNTPIAAAFIANEVLLLRRNIDGGKYAIAAKFKMQGLSRYDAKQTSLFV